MTAENIYSLYNKNERILDFSCVREEKTEEKYGGKDSPQFTAVKKYSELLPIGFTNITAWLTLRRAPVRRLYFPELLQTFGCDDIETFILMTHCVSLTDTFWAKPADDELCWEDVSLFANSFDERIARAAFDGRLFGAGFPALSPEFTTDGVFPKCWVRFDSGISLLKQGLSGVSISGREPFSELYVYELAKHMCTSPLSYELIRHKGRLASRCRLFTSEKTGFAPFAMFAGRYGTLDKMLGFFDSIGSGEEFRQMLVLDALTYNTDRSMKNFGVLFDTDTMQPLRMAPVFDNNLALFPYADVSDLKNIREYAATRSCVFKEGFDGIAKKCMTDGIRNSLLNLKGFSFESRHRYHLPEERLTLLSDMVRMRIDDVLEERVFPMLSQERLSLTLDSFFLTVNRQDVPEQILEKLLAEAFSLPEFALFTKDGSILIIKSGRYVANAYSSRIEIDIFDAVIEGNAEEPEIADVGGLYLLGGEECTPPLMCKAELDAQMSLGENLFFSSLSGLSFGFAEQYWYEHTLLPQAKSRAVIQKFVRQNGRLPFPEEAIADSAIKKALITLAKGTKQAKLPEKYLEAKKKMDKETEKLETGQINAREFANLSDVHLFRALEQDMMQLIAKAEKRR